MIRSITLSCLLILSTLIPFVSSAASGPPTAADLMTGLTVPLKREFPLNPGISPCADFYQHVCSKTIQSFELPKEKSGWTFSFNDNDEKILNARKVYLASLKNFTPATEHGRALKSFHQGCMDASAGAKDEHRQVDELKKQVTSLKTRDQFIDYVTTQALRPYFAFVNYDTDSDQENPDKSAAILIAGATTYPEKTYYDKKENLKELQKVVEAFFKDLKMTNPLKRATHVVDFEKSYAATDVLQNVYRERFGQKNDFARADLIQKYPNLKLAKVFARFPDDVKIRVIVPETMTFINDSLGSYDLDALKDVYLYFTARSFMDDGYPQFFNRQWDFNHRILGGPETRRRRDLRCAEDIDARFAKELDSELIDILFKDFPSDKVRTLAEKIRSTILDQLKSSNWLSADAKKEAIHKIQSAKLYLVKPANDKEWDFNPQVVYDPATPIANRVALRRALIDKELAELKEPRNRVRWDMGPLTLNAYYSPPDNKFTLLQGILQRPFFSPDASEIENFGAIGSVVGHELGHSIDDQGARYDADGKFHQWMTEADLKAFKSRTAKLVEQFNKIGHDGVLTLGENIGDNVGVHASYQAIFPKDKGSLDDKQKFFYAYARVWCQKVLPKREERLLKTNPHAMGYARVNEQVVHMNGFYEAFSCKPGDKMYRAPEDRVQIW